MRVLIAGLCLLLGAASPGTRAAPAKKEKEDPAKADLAKLEGSWQVVGMVVDGVEAPAEVVKALGSVTFKGKDYTWSDPSQPAGKIAGIDPTRKPKEIDYEAADGDGNVVKQFAIYELDGDTFRDCITTDEKSRPKAFESKAGSGHILMTYKRVKKDD